MKIEDLNLIIKAIETGKCLAFLGAGACTPFKKNDREEVPGLPTGGQLARILAEQCQYSNGNAYDLLKVAEYFMYAHGGDRDMPEYFRKTWIPFCTLLFLGYGLADWNFRVIWEGVLSGYARQAWRKEAYALVMDSTHFQKKYWSRKNVDIFDQDFVSWGQSKYFIGQNILKNSRLKSSSNKAEKRRLPNSFISSLPVLRVRAL